MLIVMAGLPGVGKSTIAAELASGRRCALLSVDPIEAAMWRAGVERTQPTGLAPQLTRPNESGRASADR
ncbi:AAA family ATPase [Microbacterium wangruii]|uniref:AAA family ATPase n=1 Tax=Microbacterium wangruii TaxID=3049073 RepID=UPI00256ED487|nr:AAA family ATPase [Microbacterium sp. zg-Y1211]MDL5486951.1 AAA family ATPase [Microbacterium sp. zg-Y1211]